MEKVYKMIAYASCTVLLMVFIGWIGWISATVVGLSSSQRTNKAQWDAIKELREADKVLVERLGILEGNHRSNND